MQWLYRSDLLPLSINQSVNTALTALASISPADSAAFTSTGAQWHTHTHHFHGMDSYLQPLMSWCGLSTSGQSANSTYPVIGRLRLLNYWSSFPTLMQEPLALTGASPYGRVSVITLWSLEAKTMQLLVWRLIRLEINHIISYIWWGLS